MDGNCWRSAKRFERKKTTMGRNADNKSWEDVTKNTKNGNILRRRTPSQPMHAWKTGIEMVNIGK